MNEPTTEAGRGVVNDVREFVIHGVRDRITSPFELAWKVAAGVVDAEAEARDNLATRLGTRLLDEKDGTLATALREGIEAGCAIPGSHAEAVRAALLRAVETDHE